MRIIRYEFKYFIDENMYHEIMDCIAQYLIPDPYAAKLPGYRYMINSLYLDSPSKLYYDEKMTGLRFRRKVRMRCYSTDFYSANIYFAEIKKRDQYHIDKIRIKMNREDFNQFMDHDFLFCPDGYLNGDITNRKNMEELLYFCNRHILTPTNFVLYEREAYMAKNDDTVRITFDRSVMSQNSFASEATDSQNWVSVFPGKTIFEIKVRTLLPFWLHNLVKKFGLQFESISKYCEGVDAVEMGY